MLGLCGQLLIVLLHCATVEIDNITPDWNSDKCKSMAVALRSAGMPSGHVSSEG